MTDSPLSPTASRLAKSLALLHKRNERLIKLGLDAETALLERLGNPHIGPMIIHVAGTNGKGSVCAMLASILQAAGLTTGLYTSPHLVHFNERVRVNGNPISDDELADLLECIEENAQAAARQEGGRDVTFFEFTTALAFQYFKRKKVQVMVLETGLGGRLDATNVVTPAVTVITSIGMDHMAYLGDTLEKIAAEKAGIIKPGHPVICGDLPDEARVMVEKAVRERGATLVYARDVVSIQRVRQTFAGQKIRVESSESNYGTLTLPLLGSHQLGNCALAIAALESLQQKTSLRIPMEAVAKGLEKVNWPSRCQVLSTEPPVILDGAHNTEAAHALARALDELGKGRQLGLIVSFLADKDCAGFMRELAGKVRTCWAVPIHNERAMPLKDIVAGLRSVGLEPVESTLAQALRDAEVWASAGQRMVCITGSLYLAGEVMRIAPAFKSS